jgi:RsiW-degrading membrane proteinase PrsW (M82 family)
MINGETILFATLGGFIPALLWLWFWRHEDAHREPWRLTLLTFFAGMITVALVIPLQKQVAIFFTGSAIIFLWAVIEEVLKFVMAYITVLRDKEVDEPIDPMIYMITIALGFAAVENTLFLINPIANSGILDSIMTGNFRFLGASLLHVLSSSMVGAMLGLSFYRRRVLKIEYAVIGLILAIGLHSLFNFLILKTTGAEVLRVFVLVWLGIVAM